MEEQKVVTEEQTVVTDSSTQTPEKNTASPKKFLSMQHIIALVVVCAAIAVSLYLWSNKTESTNVLEATSAYPEVVATVNGEEVQGSELEKSVAQSQQRAVQQGLDPKDPAIKAQIESEAMDVLVNTKLLLQASKEEGITVTPEQIDEQIALLQTQFGGAEGFQTQLDTLGIPQDVLRSDLESQIAIETYLKATDEFTTVGTVSDADIAEAYAGFLTQNPELPPLTEISDQIKAQLESEKQQTATGAVIERLRADAKIEVTS